MYLGKNQHVTKSARETIRKYCLANGLGREDIADELGIVKGTLDNKLKMDPKNCFTVEEVLKLCEITDDDSILKTMCAERGLVVYDPIETMADGGDVVHEMLVGVLDIDNVVGKFAKEVKAAIEDGEIDEKEADTLGELLKVMRSVERKMEVMLKRHKEGL